jgi:hypothetical protein
MGAALSAAIFDELGRSTGALAMRSAMPTAEPRPTARPRSTPPWLAANHDQALLELLNVNARSKSLLKHESGLAEFKSRNAFESSRLENLIELAPTAKSHSSGSLPSAGRAGEGGDALKGLRPSL